MSNCAMRFWGFSKLSILLTLILSVNSVFAAELSLQAIADLEQAAQEDITQKDYIGARGKYQRVLQDCPDAVRSKSGLVRTSLFLGDLTTAETELQDLVSNYSSHADIATAVREAADGYRDTGNYSKAAQVYKMVETSWPSDSDIINTKRGLACSLIIQNNISEAEPLVNEILSDHLGHTDAAIGIREIADHYRARGKYNEATDLYKTVESNWPENSDAMSCKWGLACSLIMQDNISESKPVVAKLISDYPNNKHIAKAVLEIAEDYHIKNHRSEAIQLYREMEKRWPSSPEMIKCQWGLANSLILEADSVSAKPVVDKIISEYSSHPDTAMILRNIADHYFVQDKFEQATELYRKVESDWTGSSEMMNCQWGLARSLIRQDNLADAKVAIDKLLSEYSTHPNISKAIHQIANQYRKMGYHSQAVELYRKVEKQAPDDVDMFGNQLGLTCSLIGNGDIDSAKMAEKKLLFGYSNNANISKAAKEIAYSYRCSGQYIDAARAYQNLTAKWPDAPEAMDAHCGLACNLLLQKDTAGAEPVVDKLLSDYSTHPNIAKAVLDVADEYYEIKMNQKALDLYKKVLTFNPSPAISNRARGGIAAINLRLGDESNVQSEVEFLFSNNDEADGGAKSIYKIAEEHYLKTFKIEDKAVAKDYHQRAIAILDNYVLKMTDCHALKASTYYTLGLAYQGLGEYSKAAESFKDSYKSNPKFRYADYCMFSVGRCYEKLSDSYPNASDVTRSQYEQLIAEYPDSSYVKIAKKWLMKNPK